MLCQNCNHNEVDKTFIVNWMGTQYQMSICNECLQQMWRHAESMGHTKMFESIAGWWPGKEKPRKLGESPFPEQADRAWKTRLYIAALRARLTEAAETENYEEAARLRDRIAAAEREEYFHES